MCWGLLTKLWSWWHRASAGSSSGASTGGSQRSGEPKRLIFKGRARTESSFWHFGTGPGSGGSKRLNFKGRACTESSFLDFGTGPERMFVPSGLLFVTFGFIFPMLILNAQ